VKLSFVSILWSLMLVSGPAESAQEPKGQIPNEYKKPAIIGKPDPQNQRQAGAPTAFEKSLIETLRTIADQQKADYEQRRADQKPWWIDPGLLGIGFVYTVFAGLQWWAICRQAKIAADNVLATRELAYLERPWLIVKPGDPNWPFTQTVSAAPPFVVTIGWSAINEGRSPAFLTNLSVSLVCAPKPTDDDRPEYEIFRDFAEMPIPPRGAHGGEKFLTVNDSDLESIKAGTLCIKFYGFLEYYDPSRRNLHKTRFCAYWYMLNSSLSWMLTFVPVGPRAYIEYT